MRDSTRVLMLVAVLSTGTCSRIPFNAKVLFTHSNSRTIGIDYCYCHGACVNTALALGWGDTLYSVSPGLIF